ncbi:hypothetical protein K443DRAFT_550657 [Laccaria amethystina LaAM-08-1]|uniref:Uncharacterized protein n=1 Tax=Laccaria amethystina LaAM-08-1 TaxID=1095629 RepID=A0A0C9WSE3_9AGAR|nr:hypothetical protein K443DRAFT_550657 [Laccaria amethystina LaAM-08-1]
MEMRRPAVQVAQPARKLGLCCTCNIASSSEFPRFSCRECPSPKLNCEWSGTLDVGSISFFASLISLISRCFMGSVYEIQDTNTFIDFGMIYLFLSFTYNSNTNIFTSIQYLHLAIDPAGIFPDTLLPLPDLRR